MRRFLKFLHTVGAAGLMGGAAAIVAMLAPASVGADPAPILDAIAKIAAWVIGPSMVVTIVSGLLAMAANAAFQDVAWVWVKAATGVLILQAGLHVLGPIQEAAKRLANAPADGPAALDPTHLLEAEINTLWVLLAVSAANIALGVWRPRFPKYPV
ncbi:MAG: DUF2269 family protein [Alphaproteobacteria bacterium]|nr:DUF2269 family protein [Alphaproteobacteria bacterium]